MTTTGTITAGLFRGRFLLLMLVPGLLLVDMVNGMVGGSRALVGVPSPSELARGAVLLWALLVMIRVVHPGLRRLQLWVVALGLSGAIGLVVTFLRGGDGSMLVEDISLLSKVLYGPALVLLLAVLFRRYRLDPPGVLDAVAWVAGVAGGSIALLKVAGLGQYTYAEAEVGGKGWFIAQNDLSVALGIGLVAALHLAIRQRRIRYVLLAMLGFTGMLIIGTRAAMLAAFALPVAMLLIHRSSLYPGRRRVFVGILGVAALLLALSVAAAWEFRNIRAERKQQEKLQMLADNPFVRGLRVVAAWKSVEHQPLSRDLFGQGMTTYGRGVARALGVQADVTLAEVDWMDMFGAYGAVFTVLAYAFYLGFLRHARVVRRRYGSMVSQSAVLALAWFLLHSMVAGHALTGTIPAGTLAPILSLLWVEAQPSLTPPFSEVTVG